MKAAQRAAVILLVVGSLVLLALMASRVASRGRFASAYSTYGSGPSGTRGLFLMLEEQGKQPVRWSTDLAHLPENGMLVALGGCEVFVSRPLARYEVDALRAWIDGGGTLVVAGARDYLPSDFGVTITPPPRDCEPTTGFLGALFRASREAESGRTENDDPAAENEVRDGIADPVSTYEELDEGVVVPKPELASTWGPLEGLGAVGVRQPVEVTTEEAEAKTLLTPLFTQLASGASWGTVIPRGQGRIVFLASASPFQNRDLREGSALFQRLVSAYAPSGPIVFDEFHLGVGERRSFASYLRELGFGALVIQILIVVLLLLARASARWGATRALPEPPAADTRTFVSAIGTLYSKAGDPTGAFLRIVRHALVRVAAHHHIASNDPEALASRLEERSRGEEAAAVRSLAALTRTAALASPRDLVARTAEVDELVARATQPLGGSA